MRPDGLADNFYFGGGVSSTTLTPLAWGLFVAAGILILTLPRKYVMAPFLIVGLLLSGFQQMVVGGVHLPVYRLLVLMGWIRILLRRDPLGRPLGALDKAIIAWAVTGAIMYSILWGEFSAFVNRMGYLYNICGVYFLARYLVRDREDVLRAVKILSFVSLLIAVFMVNEHNTGQNLFSIFGGTAEYSLARDGKIRAQGPFDHPIVAGTFGAVLLTMYVALWLQGKGNRLFAAIGVGSSLAIAVASASSTPLMAMAAGLGGLCLWPLRRRMSYARWGLVLALIAVQAVMNNPIWFIMARLGGSIGGTGWHRSELIDQFVRHFSDWWLIGTRDNANWGLDMWDTVDAYVNAGVSGGLITLVLFLTVLVFAFKAIGRARARFDGDSLNERLIWAIGATLFANTVAFFGIIYYDQSSIAWYFFLAMISAVSAWVPEEIAEEDDSLTVEPDASYLYPRWSQTAAE